MSKVDDVAAYILQRTGPLNTWKFQKLVYYSQAWHLVWEGRPLFPDGIEAWANGPVAPALYREHRGQYEVRTWPRGDGGRLAPDETSSVDAVLDAYANKTGHWLSALTHREPPWRRARHGLVDGERGHREITKEAMSEYYGGLV